MTYWGIMCMLTPINKCDDQRLYISSCHRHSTQFCKLHGLWRRIFLIDCLWRTKSLRIVTNFDTNLSRICLHVRIKPEKKCSIFQYVGIAKILMGRDVLDNIMLQITCTCDKNTRSSPKQIKTAWQTLPNGSSPEEAKNWLCTNKIRCPNWCYHMASLQSNQKEFWLKVFIR